MIDRRNGILPEEIGCGGFRTQVTGFGAHIPVGQLKPGFGKGLRKLIRMLVVAARDGFVNRVHLHGHIRCCHDRSVPLRGVESVRYRIGSSPTLGNPLPCPRRTFHHFPIIFEQRIEIAVVPLCRRRRPGPFNPAGNGIDADPRLKGALPAQALIYDAGSFWFRTHMGRVASPMAFAKGMPPRCQGDGFFVIHRHAAKGLSHILPRAHRIRFAVRTFRIHIDEPHAHGCQGIFQHAIAAIPFATVVCLTMPGRFRTPVNILFRLPDILTSSGKTKGLKAHRFQRTVARKDH